MSNRDPYSDCSVLAFVHAPARSVTLDNLPHLLIHASLELQTCPQANGSTSGTPQNTTSLPRDCCLRASAVMGFRCPDKGMLTKPIFIVAPCFRSYEPQLGHGHLFSLSSCTIEHRDLGQELVTRAMDCMKVLGMGRLCF